MSLINGRMRQVRQAGGLVDDDPASDEVLGGVGVRISPSGSSSAHQKHAMTVIHTTCKELRNGLRSIATAGWGHTKDARVLGSGEERGRLRCPTQNTREGGDKPGGGERATRRRSNGPTCSYDMST